MAETHHLLLFMMTDARTLVLATVIDINSSTISYLSCAFCNTKLQEDLSSDANVYVCQRCHRSYANDDVNHRYRVSMRIAADETECDVTIFGSCLNQIFGASAKKFAQIQDVLQNHGIPQSQVQIVVRQAFQECIIGKKYYFGFRIPRRTETLSLKYVMETAPSCGVVAYQVMALGNLDNYNLYEHFKNLAEELWHQETPPPQKNSSKTFNESENSSGNFDKHVTLTVDNSGLDFSNISSVNYSHQQISLGLNSMEFSTTLSSQEPSRNDSILGNGTGTPICSQRATSYVKYNSSGRFNENYTDHNLRLKDNSFLLCAADRSGSCESKYRTQKSNLVPDESNSSYVFKKPSSVKSKCEKSYSADFQEGNPFDIFSEDLFPEESEPMATSICDESKHFTRNVKDYSSSRKSDWRCSDIEVFSEHLLSDTSEPTTLTTRTETKNLTDNAKDNCSKVFNAKDSSKSSFYCVRRSVASQMPTVTQQRCRVFVNGSERTTAKNTIQLGSDGEKLHNLDKSEAKLTRNQNEKLSFKEDRVCMSKENTTTNCLQPTQDTRRSSVPDICSKFESKKDDKLEEFDLNNFCMWDLLQECSSYDVMSEDEEFVKRNSFSEKVSNIVLPESENIDDFLQKCEMSLSTETGAGADDASESSGSKNLPCVSCVTQSSHDGCLIKLHTTSMPGNKSTSNNANRDDDVIGSSGLSGKGLSGKSGETVRKRLPNNPGKNTVSGHSDCTKFWAPESENLEEFLDMLNELENSSQCGENKVKTYMYQEEMKVNSSPPQVSFKPVKGVIRGSNGYIGSLGDTPPSRGQNMSEVLRQKLVNETSDVLPCIAHEDRVKNVTVEIKKRNGSTENPGSFQLPLNRQPAPSPAVETNLTNNEKDRAAGHTETAGQLCNSSFEDLEFLQEVCAMEDEMRETEDESVNGHGETKKVEQQVSTVLDTNLNIVCCDLGERESKTEVIHISKNENSLCQTNLKRHDVEEGYDSHGVIAERDKDISVTQDRTTSKEKVLVNLRNHEKLSLTNFEKGVNNHLASSPFEGRDTIAESADLSLCRPFVSVEGHIETLHVEDLDFGTQKSAIKVLLGDQSSSRSQFSERHIDTLLVEDLGKEIIDPNTLTGHLRSSLDAHESIGDDTAMQEDSALDVSCDLFSQNSFCEADLSSSCVKRKPVSSDADICTDSGLGRSSLSLERLTECEIFYGNELGVRNAKDGTSSSKTHSKNLHGSSVNTMLDCDLGKSVSCFGKPMIGDSNKKQAKLDQVVFARENLLSVENVCLSTTNVLEDCDNEQCTLTEGKLTKDKCCTKDVKEQETVKSGNNDGLDLTKSKCLNSKSNLTKDPVPNPGELHLAEDCSVSMEKSKHLMPSILGVRRSIGSQEDFSQDLWSQDLFASQALDSPQNVPNFGRTEIHDEVFSREQPKYACSVSTGGNLSRQSKNKQVSNKNQCGQVYKTPCKSFARRHFSKSKGRRSSSLCCNSAVFTSSTPVFSNCSKSQVPECSGKLFVTNVSGNCDKEHCTLTYRKLTEGEFCTKEEEASAHPIPRIPEVLRSMGGQDVFSQDLWSQDLFASQAFESPQNESNVRKNSELHDDVFREQLNLDKFACSFSPKVNLSKLSGDKQVSNKKQCSGQVFKTPVTCKSFARRHFSISKSRRSSTFYGNSPLCTSKPILSNHRKSQVSEEFSTGVEKKVQETPRHRKSLPKRCMLPSPSTTTSRKSLKSIEEVIKMKHAVVKSSATRQEQCEKQGPRFFVQFQCDFEEGKKNVLSESVVATDGQACPTPKSTIIFCSDFSPDLFSDCEDSPALSPSAKSIKRRSQTPFKDDSNCKTPCTNLQMEFTLEDDLTAASFDVSGDLFSD